MESQSISEVSVRQSIDRSAIMDFNSISPIFRLLEERKKMCRYFKDPSYEEQKEAIFKQIEWYNQELKLVLNLF
jgi:hypothetical protein